MVIYENTRLDDWMNIHHENCDCRHMIRGCRSIPELIYWLSNNLYVDFECDNINCSHKWKIYKSVFFIDDTSVITYLKCPNCKKLSVTAKWINFTSEMMGQWECESRWMYDVLTSKRYFECKYGIDDDCLTRFDKVPGFTPVNIESYRFGLILHSHQQYIIRTEGNHFV